MLLLAGAQFSRKIALAVLRARPRTRMEVDEIKRTVESQQLTHVRCRDTGGRKISDASLEVGLIKPGECLTRLTRLSCATKFAALRRCELKPNGATLS